jgi:radical SAM enzyme (TIGR01210 family)
LQKCGIAKACKEWRDRAGKGSIDRDPKRYVACWSEREVLGKEQTGAFVVILRTKGCFWAREAGCSFCGYVSDASPDVSTAELEIQLASALKRYKDEAVLKIYTSGSFLDEDEVPPEFQGAVLDKLSEMGVRKLVIETLPRFVTEEKVSLALDRFGAEEKKGLQGDGGIEFALGLESATPEVFRTAVNKSGRVEDYWLASERIKTLGGRVRMYIVIKPPLLSEREALEDAVLSAKAVGDKADTISFNPINIQRGTVVERLWRRGEYQPPWLWTVSEVLRRTAELDLGPRIMSGPTGGGTRRGAHNCGECDKRVLRAINRFSLTGEVSYLEKPGCGCMELWKDQLELEDLVHGPFQFDRRFNR